MNSVLCAGVAAGIAGLLTFLVLHHLWIRPIWFIAPIALIMAAVGGLVVGWSYSTLQANLPPRPWTALAVVGLIVATLLPSILLAQTRPALIDLSTGVIPPGAGPEVGIRFVLELIVTAVAVGGMAGWLIGRTPQAALSTALAGLVYALGPGHNIPLLGSTTSVGKGLGLLLAITIVSSVVLVEVAGWLARKSG